MPLPAMEAAPRFWPQPTGHCPRWHSLAHPRLVDPWPSRYWGWFWGWHGLRWLWGLSHALALHCPFWGTAGRGAAWRGQLSC
ncbi:MAG: hypothetical protein ACK59G_00095 [Cyanobacteriota bacterium]